MDLQNPRVARLLARHFNDMQGLRYALAGVCIAIPTSAYLLTNNGVAAVALMLPAFAAMAAGNMLLDRVYAREFGRVRVDRRVLLFPMIAGITAGLEPHGWPSIACALLAMRAAWIVWDCWPRRSYHILTTAGWLYLSITWMRVPAISTGVWMAQGMLILSWTYIPTGIADHLLLTRLLRRQPGSVHEHIR